MAIPVGKLSICAFLLLVTSSLLVSQCQATPVRQEDHRILFMECAIEGDKAARNVHTLDIKCSELRSSLYDLMIATAPELAYECEFHFELGCNQSREYAACVSGVSMVLSDFPRNVNFSCHKVTGLNNKVNRAVALGLPVGNSVEVSLSKVLNVNDAAINSSLSHRLNHTDPLVTSTTSTTSTTPTTPTTPTTTTTPIIIKNATSFPVDLARKVAFELPINSSLSHRVNHSYPLVTSTLTSTTSTTSMTPTTPTTTTTPIIIKNLEKHEYIPKVYSRVIEAHSGLASYCYLVSDLIRSEEKKDCLDIDKCVISKKPCEYPWTCFVMLRGFLCCPPETKLAETLDCTYIDYCANKPCPQSESDQFCVNYFAGRKCIDRIEKGYKNYSPEILQLIDGEDREKPKFLQISQKEVQMPITGSYGDYEKFGLIRVKLPDGFQCDWNLTLDDVWAPDFFQPFKLNQFDQEIKPNEFRAYISGRVYPQSFRVSITCEIDRKPYYRNTIYFTFRKVIKESGV